MSSSPPPSPPASLRPVNRHKVYTLAEVSKHASDTEQVWIVIHDKVYDVTKFLGEHPGGEEVLKDKAGEVGSEEFEDIGHSTDARELMAQFQIGVLAEEDRQHTKEKAFDWSSSDAKPSSSSKWQSLLATLAVLVGCAVFFYYKST